LSGDLSFTEAISRVPNLPKARDSMSMGSAQRFKIKHNLISQMSKPNKGEKPLMDAGLEKFRNDVATRRAERNVPGKCFDFLQAMYVRNYHKFFCSKVLQFCYSCKLRNHELQASFSNYPFVFEFVTYVVQK
jgi:hypothetical protein